MQEETINWGGRKTTGCQTDGNSLRTGACLNHGRSVNTTASSFMVCQDQHHAHQGGGVGGSQMQAACMSSLLQYINHNVNSSLYEPMKSSLGASSASLSPLPLVLSQHHSFRADSSVQQENLSYPHAHAHAHSPHPHHWN